MLPCVYAKSHKTERDRWDVIKDGTIYKNGLRRARKASLYFAGEESKYFIWTFVDQRKKTTLSTKKAQGKYRRESKSQPAHLCSWRQDASEVGKYGHLNIHEEGNKRLCKYD